MSKFVPGSICMLSIDGKEQMVMVYRDSSDMGIDGIVRVAQIGSNPECMADGDIPLFGHLFAESWNTYPAAEEDLSSPMYTACREDVAALLNAENAERKAIEKDSATWQFRKSEISKGSFFGSIGAGKALAIYEA